MARRARAQRRRFSTPPRAADGARSSTRSTPRTSVGKNGSIRFICSSLSQKQILLTNFNLPPKNHYLIVSEED